MDINPEKFQESITKELEVVKDRVRNLIGSAHWGMEGRFKEAVLTNVIRRFLPSHLSVGTGFVVRSKDRQLPELITVSKQIDIIVYDNRTPVLFSEGDFIITSPTNVRAIVEVKTKIDNSKLRETLRTSINNAKMINHAFFSGIFAFSYQKRNFPEQLRETLEAIGKDGKHINHISLGPHIFIKHWTREKPEDVDSHGCNSDFYGIYDFAYYPKNPKRLSFSYFISNLVYTMSGQQLSDRLWLLFPAIGGKEGYRVGTACLGTRT